MTTNNNEKSTVACHWDKRKRIVKIVVYFISPRESSLRSFHLSLASRFLFCGISIAFFGKYRKLFIHTHTKENTRMQRLFANFPAPVYCCAGRSYPRDFAANADCASLEVIAITASFLGPYCRCGGGYGLGSLGCGCTRICRHYSRISRTNA